MASALGGWYPPTPKVRYIIVYNRVRIYYSNYSGTRLNMVLLNLVFIVTLYTPRVNFAVVSAGSQWNAVNELPTVQQLPAAVSAVQSATYLTCTRCATLRYCHHLSMSCLIFSIFWQQGGYFFALVCWSVFGGISCLWNICKGLVMRQLSSVCW